MPKTYQIEWIGLNRVTPIVEDQTVLDVAIEHDIPLNHACGGFCACTTCHIMVRAGMEHISEMQDDEQDRLEDHGILTENSRLACQSKVRGDIKVEIPE